MKTSTDGWAVPKLSVSQQFFKRSPITVFAVEWLAIILLAYFYGGKLLLDFDAAKLQQTGEHNESATLPLLAEIGLSRYGEIPLWNPYMLTGVPQAGDFLSHFWNPVSTIPIMIWGGINGFKVSIFLTLIIAGLGQWLFAYVMGLRRMFRLWSSLLFMISGGLAMFWRVGWYELLLGAAWFPWCFALYWSALQRQTRSSIFLVSLAIFMVISTGGGYYPIYLAVCLAVLTILALLTVKPDQRVLRIRTAGLIALCSLAISAVVLVPYVDGYRYLVRDIAPDVEQHFSQPIQYGLINYVIHTPEWFRADVLGTASGWNWFYIGWLPIAALAFVPLVFARSRKYRWAMIVTGVLFLILLLWFANRFSPFKEIYEWIPFLYRLRFPNRLLVIATSPLLIFSAQALEYIYRVSKAAVKNNKLVYQAGKKAEGLPLRQVIPFVWLFVLITTTKTVFDVNKVFAFSDGNLNPNAFAALNWLKNQDPSLYYVNIGGVSPYWNWLPAAYTLEMPVINFLYSRQMVTQELQRAQTSPFMAQAKYQISAAEEPVPENALAIKEFDGVFIWQIPGALPYAFSVQPTLIQAGDKLASDQVTALNVSLRPNRVVVKGTPGQDGDVLVVLMSHYPGWKLLIDGKPAQLKPYNHYLGTNMLAGEHEYAFYFLPAQFVAGAAISVLALVFMVITSLFLPVRSAIRKLHKNRAPSPHLEPVA